MKSLLLYLIQTVSSTSFLGATESSKYQQRLMFVENFFVFLIFGQKGPQNMDFLLLEILSFNFPKNHLKGNLL